jgi:hypothetical protein
MKTLRNIVISAALLTAGIGFVAHKSSANLEVSAGVEIHDRADFDAPLAGHGAWIDTHDYGRCFRPAGIEVNWRPYCDGEWIWTDCGWYWASDEPWAWACYHYGTWVDDPVYGWIWVPDVEWAPAWVEWRVGGGYIGWAPCAPHGEVVAPEFFAFVDVDRFQDHVRRSALVFNNPTVIRQTIRLAGEGRETRTFDGRTQPVVFNHGPGIAAVEKATGHAIKTVPIREEARSTPTTRPLQPDEKSVGPVRPDKTVMPEHAQPPAKDLAVPAPEHQPPPTRNDGGLSPEHHAPPDQSGTHAERGGDNGGGSHSRDMNDGGHRHDHGF